MITRQVDVINLNRHLSLRRGAAVLIAALMLSALPAGAFADDDYESQLASLNSEKAAASERRASAQNRVLQLKTEQADLIEEKLALEERNAAAEEEIRLIKQQIELIRQEISDTEDMIAAKMADVENARAVEEEQLEKYKSRIRAMEENSGYNILALLLESDSFSTLLSGLDDYGEIMDSDKTLYEQLLSAREDHQRLQAEYEQYEAECKEKKASFEQDKRALEIEQEQLEVQILDSQEQISEYTRLIAEAEAEQAAAERAEAAASAAAANFVAEYQARKNAALSQQIQASTVTQTEIVTDTVIETIINEFGEEEQVEREVQYEVEVEVPVENSPADNVYSGATGTGSYVWPFPGHYVVTSPFGYRSSTGSNHTGIDIDGFQSGGSPIVAADGGTVILAEYYGGYGNCIIIDHGNGMSTLYAHLSSMNYGVGSSVGQGETIGGVGNTGNCYGADGIHLHFEVISGGTQVDPLNYLGGYSYSFY